MANHAKKIMNAFPLHFAVAIIFAQTRVFVYTAKRSQAIFAITILNALHNVVFIKPAHTLWIAISPARKTVIVTSLTAAVKDSASLRKMLALTKY